MRATWLWIVCSFVAFVVGCADRPAPPLALEFDEGTPVEARETVLRAAADWNERIGRTVFYPSGERATPGCDRIRVRFVEEMPEDYDDYSGLFEQVGCHYRVLILHDFADDQANAAHELGHTLELEHSPDRHSVMYWSTLPGARITREDVARVRLRWQL